jgi:hypothetical protein
MSKQRPPSRPDADIALVTANLAEIVGLPYENQALVVNNLAAEQGTYTKADIQ